MEATRKQHAYITVNLYAAVHAKRMYKTTDKYMRRYFMYEESDMHKQDRTAAKMEKRQMTRTHTYCRPPTVRANYLHSRLHIHTRNVRERINNKI